jgi:hypothetical protein
MGGPHHNLVLLTFKCVRWTNILLHHAIVGFHQISVYLKKFIIIEHHSFKFNSPPFTCKIRKFWVSTFCHYIVINCVRSWNCKILKFMDMCCKCEKYCCNNWCCLVNFNSTMEVKFIGQITLQWLCLKLQYKCNFVVHGVFIEILLVFTYLCKSQVQNQVFSFLRVLRFR